MSSEDDDLDIVHLVTRSGCKISVNGQGHFPCTDHPGDVEADCPPPERDRG